MKTQDRIQLIVETRYNGYRGRVNEQFKMLHDKIRDTFGDEYLLELLNKTNEKFPSIPKYEIPESAKNAISNAKQQD